MNIRYPIYEGVYRILTERVPVFALCPEKITPDGFAVPNIFCRPKLFSIPPSFLLCAVKKGS